MSAALDVLGPGEPPAPETSEQLDMLPKPDEDREQSADFELDGDGVPVTRGPGRPKGARNKRSEDMVKLILSQGKSPLQFLAGHFQAETKVIKKRYKLGTLAEAEAIQRAAAIAALPYIHEKRPIALEVDSRETVQIIVGQVPNPDKLDQAEETGVSLVIEATAEEIEENQ